MSIHRSAALRHASLLLLTFAACLGLLLSFPAEAAAQSDGPPGPLVVVPAGLVRRTPQLERAPRHVRQLEVDVGAGHDGVRPRAGLGGLCDDRPRSTDEQREGADGQSAARAPVNPHVLERRCAVPGQLTGLLGLGGAMMIEKPASRTSSLKSSSLGPRSSSFVD